MEKRGFEKGDIRMKRGRDEIRVLEGMAGRPDSWGPME